MEQEINYYGEGYFDGLNNSSDNYPENASEEELELYREGFSKGIKEKMDLKEQLA